METIENPVWIIYMIVILSTLYFRDLLRNFLGGEIVWNQLKKFDKLLVFIGLSLFLLFFLLPIKEQLSLVAVLISTLFGYILFCLTIYFWGSDTAKEKLGLWPKRRSRHEANK